MAIKKSVTVMAVVLQNSADFQKHLESDKLVIGWFTATWCGPCVRVKPAVEALAEKYKDKVLIVSVDVDAHGEVFATTGAQGVPTFVFYKGGKEVEKFSGADAARIEKVIQEHA